jgi:hypothetical protein
VDVGVTTPERRTVSRAVERLGYCTLSGGVSNDSQGDTRPSQQRFEQNKS